MPVEGQPGLTKREYMAAKAMQGLISGAISNGAGIEWEAVAKGSILAADALLKELENESS